MLTLKPGENVMKRFIAAAVLALAPISAHAAQVTAQLSWTASAGATSYVVERNINGGVFAQVGTPVASPFTDSGLALGTTYCYHVAAVNTAGQSAFSAPDVCGTSASVPPVPGGTVLTITITP